MTIGSVSNTTLSKLASLKGASLTPISDTVLQKHCTLLCEKCRSEVTSVLSFTKGSIFSLIAECHGDSRRIDISLTAFRNDVNFAIEYIERYYQFVFGEEAKWQDLGTPETVHTQRENIEALEDWLKG